MAHRSRAELTVVVLRGGGRAARTLRLSALLRAALSLGMVACVALPLALGAMIQRAQGPRPSVLYAVARKAHKASDSRRFGMFQLVMPRNTTATSEQLLRRASILHALKLGLGTPRAASSLHAGIVAPEWEADAALGEPQDGTLLWPVRDGYYVRGFGSGSGGYHLAVDIQGTRGTPVLAAASGVVGYAANVLRGYGNAIMIVHPGGLVTLYAHNDRNDVVAGQRVRRGQRIGLLGNTGISRGPHVHFELMHGGRNCDPVPLFRPGVLHRGYLGDVEQTTWRPGSERPSAVRCAPRKKHPNSRWGDHDHEHEGEGEPIAKAESVTSTDH